MNYYNDNDPKACAWIRELIADRQIPDGVVDGRSILDIQPDDLAGFVQCHFFAGIAGWPLALKLAGWPEDRQIWSGSCPCQPYSAAGKQKGNADARNLWPEFFRLIKARRPQCVIGEQVAAAIGHGWIDGVHADLEGEGYAFGHVVLGAHSVGAPHIRQRIWWGGWLANTQCHAGKPGRPSDQSREGPGARGAGASSEPRRSGLHGGVGDTKGDDQFGDSVPGAHRERKPLGGSGGNGDSGLDNAEGHGAQCGELPAKPGGDGKNHGVSRKAGGLGDALQSGLEGHAGNGDNGHQSRRLGAPADGSTPAPGGIGWENFELIPCADGKQRRIESGVAPLVAGLSRGVVPGGDPGVAEAKNSGEARVMRLRGYGNSINVVVAAQFIQALDIQW